ncbi:hypothetical protein F3Y22_tig00111780pilonHSYRG00038 [Hibiscus syriacus]|uniref:Uncharacterized protein n=1 Tax=Hibiscus syriacus TaxID=106335 RepID=A0A6A2YD56_HIBSY|nr:hypothetical protein F3Y22_tig00111780pilonHSYRG00038 [Hibiscus syriacus]
MRLGRLRIMILHRDLFKDGFGEQVSERDAELSAPLIDRRMDGQDGVSAESLMLEGMGLGSSGAIKLGLGDFIFYSVLVSRAAMYDFMTVYGCYLAIVAGLALH